MTKVLWSLILSFIKKNAIYIILLLILIPILYISVDKAMGLFGFDTKDSLRKELVAEQINKEIAISTNDALLTALDIESQSNELGLNTTINFFNNKEEVKEFYSDTLSKLREDLEIARALDEEEELKAAVEHVKSSQVTPEIIIKTVEHKPVSKRVATVQINAIWDAFEKAKPQ